MTKKEILSYLKEHKCYSAEKSFRKRFPIEYSEILLLEFPNNFVFTQKLYHYLHNDMTFDIGICPICGKRTSFLQFKRGYSKYCSLICAGKSEEKKQHMEQTNLKKYGVTNPFGSKEIRKKIRQTTIERYGVEYATQSKEIQEKTKQTNLKKYGVERASQSEEVKEKTKQTNFKKYGVECVFQNKSIREKAKQTTIEKYGVEYATQSKEIQEKTKQTNLKKYGVEYSWQADETKNKIKNTNIKKYGVEYVSQSKKFKETVKRTCFKKYGVGCPFQSEEAKEKAKQTNLKKYGSENPMQNKEIKEKAKQTNLERYGFENPACAIEIKEKTKQTCLKKYGNISPILNNEVFNKAKQTCLNNYGVEFPMQSNKIKEKSTKICLERYGVPYNCMRKEARIGHGSDSKPNLDFAAKLDSLNISYEREFVLLKYVYDFKIDNILVEINPSITHNSSINIFGGEPKSSDYHLKKSQLAWDNGYECIHIWDWDDVGRIINYLSSIVKDKIVLDFYDCEIQEVSEQDAVDFVYKNSLFPIVENCNSIGLFHNGSLVQLVSYEIGENISIVSLCSDSRYIVSNGYSCLIEYISNIYDKDICLTVDLSKDSGKMYSDLFNEIYCSGPVINQCDFGNGFYEVYDCGYKIFGYKY